LSLPEEARGPFWVWDDRAEDRALLMGVQTTRLKARGTRSPQLPALHGDPVVVAGYADMLSVRGAGGRIALTTHGIGQSYAGRPDCVQHIGSPGGLDRGDVSLFLHPGPHPAARDRKAYPRARVEMVGSPRLDRLPHRQRSGEPVVAVSTHWCATLPPAPELHSGLMCQHYGQWHGIRQALSALAKRYRVIGHGHPRLIDRITDELWEPMGIEVVRSFDDVCRMADVYVSDNSSTIYEFAATGRPVVLMDPPWYDRNVGHGLRFWSAAHVGPHVTDPRTLTDTVAEALEDGNGHRRDREDALSMVYAYRDSAASRAAVVLMDWVGEQRMVA
jgi:hypothetical protein